MLKLMLIKLWYRDEGLTTVEYAIAGGLVAAVLVGAFQLLGGNVTASINALAGLIPNG
jgi:pilus assembly protein Flp/PilA